MRKEGLSIIIPTLNEAGNICGLVDCIYSAFLGKEIVYEIIFIDDHSADGTREIIESVSRSYSIPIFLFEKKGAPGKTQSLAEGFNHAAFDLIAILDQERQYSPKVLTEIIKKLDEGYDIVAVNRTDKSAGALRNFFNINLLRFFLKFLNGINYDAGTGIRVFRKKIFEEIAADASSGAFDFDFLARAGDYGYKIASFDSSISCCSRVASEPIFLKEFFQIVIEAAKKRLRKKSIYQIKSWEANSMAGAGVAYKRMRFITHTTLESDKCAINTFASSQKKAILILLILVLAVFFLYPIKMAIGVIAVLSAVYFFDTLFNFYLSIRSLRMSPEISSTEEELSSLDETKLPVYSILCPLYKEAHMLPVFFSAIDKIDWPKEKLDVLLLLEENDKETIQAAQEMKFADYVRVLAVPDSLPKTKPKACNYGLNLARGEYVVIYDAEDIPDPLQLKKAYLGFKKAGENVWCLQAKLNYFNPNQNLLTKLFAAEYSLWFDMVLPGLQSINTLIPLGGTSNHFRRNNLMALKGWDPFNVTEDCNLGIRIFKEKKQTAIIDSVTLEEANSNIKNWMRQRSRWIKGYIQTYLVEMRHPVSFLRQHGLHAFLFQLIVGGKTAFVFINPLLWAATISYFALHAQVGDAIEKLYPPIIYYMAATSLFFGNFLAIYYYMIGCAKRKQWDLVKYVFLVPFYWFAMSVAASIAAYQLLMKPHYWEKTNHGLHFKKETDKKNKESSKPVILPKVPEKEWGFIPGAFVAKKRFKFAFSADVFFMLTLILSNFLNFLFNVFLGRNVSFESLGLITFVNTLWYIAAIFIGAFSSAINYKTAYLSAMENKTLGSIFLSSMVKKGTIIAVLLSGIWIAVIPFFSGFFNISNHNVLLLFTPVFTFGLIAGANRGFLQGSLCFSRVSLIILAESVSKFAIAVILISYKMADWAFIAIPFSIIFSAIVSLVIIRQKTLPFANIKEFAFPKRFFTASLLVGVSTMVFLSLDVILVKHYLSARLAGEYMFLALVGKMIYFFGALPNVFMATYVGRSLGLKYDPKKIFSAIYAATFLLSATGIIFLGYFGRMTVPLIFGNKAQAILPELATYTLAIAIFTLTSVIVSYRLTRKNYFFTGISLLMSLSMAAGIIIRHNAISEIVMVIFWVSIFGWIAAESLNCAWSEIRFIKRCITDFLSVFDKESMPDRILAKNKKKILIFNWRDTRHEFAGGAEVYVQEIAKFWVKKGNFVTIFSGNDSFSLREEIIDGVEIIRRGGFYAVYFWAFVYYVLRFRGKYDVIIDCENGIPFFAPLYAKEPVYCLMHHVHQEVFRRSLSRPLAMLAIFMEKRLMPLVYRKIPFITVSQSSRNEMRLLGLGEAGIQVINPGVDLANLTWGEKSEKPVILYLGRLKAYKSIEVLIKAFRRVIEYMPEAVLVIAGSGEEEENLKITAKGLGLSNKQIIFKGKVSAKEKVDLLQKAWVLVNPSFMEGWGIVTIEASACGTPVIASNVSGLRDSVRDQEAGYLVAYGDVAGFAENILKIIKNKHLRDKMGREGVAWAHNFDWKKSSEMFFNAFKDSRAQRTDNSFAFYKNNFL